MGRFLCLLWVLSCRVLLRCKSQKFFIMFTDKKELVKQVNWALRVYHPLGVIQVSDASAKWTPEGYEIRFAGGSAMIAHFAGLFL